MEIKYKIGLFILSINIHTIHKFIFLLFLFSYKFLWNHIWSRYLNNLIYLTKHGVMTSNYFYCSYKIYLCHRLILMLASYLVFLFPLLLIHLRELASRTFEVWVDRDRYLWHLDIYKVWERLFLVFCIFWWAGTYLSNLILLSIAII